MTGISQSPSVGNLNEWSPLSVPDEWKREGALKLAAAVGFGAAPGPAGAASSKASRPAYVWYPDGAGGKAEQTMSFEEAHEHASALAFEIRAAAEASGALESGTSYTVGLVLRRTAALPIAELAAFKAGATFVPCDPSWPESRVADILTEANVCAVIRDASPALQLRAIQEKEALFIDVSSRGQVRRRIPGKDLDAAELEQARASVRAALDAAHGALPWAPPEVMYVRLPPPRPPPRAARRLRAPRATGAARRAAQRLHAGCCRAPAPTLTPTQNLTNFFF